MKIKGFDKNLCCRGMQFEVGKTYDTGAADDKLQLCTSTVFHYCNSIQDVHYHYSVNEDNRFCEIEVLGAEISDRHKSGSNRIRIVREIVGAELDALTGHINGNTGAFNIGFFNSGYRNVGNWNSGRWNPGNWNTGDRNTGDCNTGTGNSGNDNAGNWNTGAFNSGGFNSGAWNSCDNSSGVFCTEPEKIRIFNKPSEMTAREFYNSKYWDALMSAPFKLTEWVKDENCAAGGHLKEHSYEEACANWWEALTDVAKEIIQSMPNFDAGVFEEITGINIKNEEDK